ncbi:MAG: dienelactone hydrolase family protein [Dehalococcoidia bacterium]|nr:dienelactone hydrolase family protein [Dehalococcoidia bacterium]
MPGTPVDFEHNGIRVSGYLARPEGTPRGGMIVIQEWWGLNDDIKGIADRYAAEGYLALAPDMYHGVVTDEPDEARKLVMALERDEAAKEIDAAVAWLKATQGVAKVGCVGFCMGGGLTLATALRPNSGIDAAHVYYGGGMPDDATLATIRVPVMGSYGADDAGIPADRVDALRNALASSGVDHDIKLYEATGHSFFNSGHSLHPQSAADSWERSKAWFAKHLA